MQVVHRRFVGKVLVKTVCTAATNYLVVPVQALCSVSTRGLVLMLQLKNNWICKAIGAS